jgi:hypothetical protein
MCIYTYIRVYTHTHTHTHTHIPIHTHTRVDITIWQLLRGAKLSLDAARFKKLVELWRSQVPPHRRPCIHMNIHMHTHTHTHTSLSHACIHTNIHMHVHTLTYTHTHTRLTERYMYSHTRARAHTHARCTHSVECLRVCVNAVEARGSEREGWGMRRALFVRPSSPSLQLSLRSSILALSLPNLRR